MNKRRRQLHMMSEAAALVLMVPFLAHVARTHPSSPTRKAALLALAATIAVDGYLLARW